MQSTSFNYETKDSHIYNLTLDKEVFFRINDSSERRVRISTFFIPNEGRDTLKLSFLLNEASINFQRQLKVKSLGDIPVDITFNYMLTDREGRTLKVPKLGPVSQPKITKDSKVFALTSYNQETKRILFKVIFITPINALLVISPTIEGIFEVINFKLTQGVTTSTLVYPVPVFNYSPKQVSSLIPLIKVKATTDAFFGSDLAQVVYTILDTKRHSQISKKSGGLFLSCVSLYIPSFDNVLITDECSLTDKIQKTASSSYSVLETVVGYGTLRYFLAWLIFGVWNVDWLLNRYDPVFYKALLESRYRNQYPILESLSSAKKYFSL